MDEHDGLAERFQENRPQLRAVAYRMLGSIAEADDAVQEAWLRLSRSDAGVIDNLGGWLTTALGRICLDMLRSRTARREDSLEAAQMEAAPRRGAGLDPEQEALLGDSVGQALLVVLNTLAPAERLAFVLHDLFEVPFDQIAPIVGRSPAAARQLASRARRRVRVSEMDAGAGQGVERAVVDAFLAASREGDFEALLAMLDPDAVLRVDAAAAAVGALPGVRGARAVATTFSGAARAARPALVNGAAGAVWAQGGQARVAFGFTVVAGRIVAIDLLADPRILAECRWV